MKIHHTECFGRKRKIKTDLALESKLETRENAQDFEIKQLQAKNTFKETIEVLEHVATLDRLKAAEVFSSVQYSY
jgi:hypothetical protein